MEITCGESAQGENEVASTMGSNQCSSTCQSFELARCTSEGLLRRPNSNRTLESDSSRIRTITKGNTDSFTRRLQGFGNRIPKRVVSLDEQYLRRCLELICSKASKVMPFDATFTLASSAIDGNSDIWKGLAVQCSPRPERGNLIMDSAHSLPCHRIAATDAKSIGGNDKHLHESPFHLTGMKSSKSMTRSNQSGLVSPCRPSISTATASVSQGMLLFAWMDGMPRFIFSSDEHQEVYVASLTRVKSSNYMDPDYAYLICFNGHGRNEQGIDKGSYLVGEIRIATSISFCPNDTEIRTTEFVLFGGYAIPVEETRDSTGENKGLPHKAVKAFKSMRSPKRRNMSRRSRRISEDFSIEVCRDKFKALKSYRHSSNELAAVVAKNRVKGATEQKPEVGGWGLKFLRKVEAGRTTKDSDECQASVDVIIPTSLHGGPRMTCSGPSSLIERWKSDGKCDCEGWDLGCPLTLLKGGSTVPGDLRSVDLIIGGSKGSNPMLRMTNVRDGLFLIRFDSSLSALQSVSVAVAYIHSHSPLIQQRLYRS